MNCKREKKREREKEGKRASGVKARLDDDSWHGARNIGDGGSGEEMKSRGHTREIVVVCEERLRLL